MTDYWVRFQIEVAEDDEFSGEDPIFQEYGNGGQNWGFRLSVDSRDGEADQLTGEMARDWFNNQMKHLVRLEREKDLEEAKPFWKRWVGGV